MKKYLFSTFMIAIMVAGAMMLSSFTTPKQNSKTKSSQIEMNGGWKIFRENVPYCDGDKGVCEGTGYVWVNTDTYQVAFSFSTTSNCTKYDLSEYTGKDGYNMRFWYNSKYHYVNIYIPAAAFN